MPVDDRLLRELRAGADAYLAGVTDRMRRPGRNVEARVLVETSIASAILAEAERSGADLVALATHGRGPVGRALLGSVADKIVRDSRTAVLLIRPHEG